MISGKRRYFGLRKQVKPNSESVTGVSSRGPQVPLRIQPCSTRDLQRCTIGSGVEAGVGISRALPHASLHSGTSRWRHWRRRSSLPAMDHWSACLQRSFAVIHHCGCGDWRTVRRPWTDHIINTCPLHRPPSGPASSTWVQRRWTGSETPSFTLHERRRTGVTPIWSRAGLFQITPSFRCCRTCRLSGEDDPPPVRLLIQLRWELWAFLIYLLYLQLEVLLKIYQLTLITQMKFSI